MEVRCPSCSSLFNLPDAIPAGSKLRCSVCKQVFRLEGVAEPAVPPVTEPQGLPLEQALHSPLAMAEQPVPLAEQGEGKPAQCQAAEQEPAQQEQNEPVPAEAVCAEAEPAAALDTVNLLADFEGASPKKSSGWKKFFLFLLLVALGAGGWWYYTTQYTAPLPSTAEAVHKVEKLAVNDVRQYYVDNTQLGKVFVVEGKVSNNFPTARDLIEVEASLYDKNKKLIKTKHFYAGTTLPLFQLQFMAEKEMDTLLSNKLDILRNNMQVQPGASVPFMAIFAVAPEAVGEFAVHIVNAKESAPASPAQPEQSPAAGQKPSEPAPTGSNALGNAATQQAGSAPTAGTAEKAAPAGNNALGNAATQQAGGAPATGAAEKPAPAGTRKP